MRFTWTATRISQSVIKEINPKYSLEGLMLKLKLQYSGHLMRRADSFEKTLILGEFGGLWEVVMDREASRAAVHGVTKSWTVKKTERQRIDVFKLWCWRRLLRVP